MRVLHVDDSRVMRNIVRSVLAQLGHLQVEFACNGEDALSKVGAVRPGLILVDRDMPKMDGLAFVRAFRQMDDRTPVIMIAAEADRDRVLEAIEAGVNNYVIKPFAPEMLARRIRDTLTRAGAAA